MRLAATLRVAAVPTQKGQGAPRSCGEARLGRKEQVTRTRARFGPTFCSRPPFGISRVLASLQPRTAIVSSASPIACRIGRTRIGRTDLGNGDATACGELVNSLSSEALPSSAALAVAPYNPLSCADTTYTCFEELSRVKRQILTYRGANWIRNRQRGKVIVIWLLLLDSKESLA